VSARLRLSRDGGNFNEGTRVFKEPSVSRVATPHDFVEEPSRRLETARERKSRTGPRGIKGSGATCASGPRRCFRGVRKARSIRGRTVRSSYLVPPPPPPPVVAPSRPSRPPPWRLAQHVAQEQLRRPSSAWDGDWPIAFRLHGLNGLLTSAASFFFGSPYTFKDPPSPSPPSHDFTRQQRHNTPSSATELLFFPTAIM
jgi:hypothetical protein